MLQELVGQHLRKLEREDVFLEELVVIVYISSAKM